MIVTADNAMSWPDAIVVIAMMVFFAFLLWMVLR